MIGSARWASIHSSTMRMRWIPSAGAEHDGRVARTWSAIQWHRRACSCSARGTEAFSARGVAASTVHVGPYHEIGSAYAALQRWMADNGRRPAGGMREVYLNDPDSVPPEALLTEIDWPVE